ncbi:G-type lectin S-receptor-like serine/threonine-protein kinase At1g11280 [Argentina anserina]|uniref:G-type lectin S-receptor-like serine/threonine-protein kinase At1g11280 n=1 Tax=Argentina anserina TaxID=57926 RepID=UPI00217682B3|nr:G-type lectin S-receptor-like serine/threonine-protein kinase At1g11280 [Potentilla anserina]
MSLESSSTPYNAKTSKPLKPPRWSPPRSPVAKSSLLNNTAVATPVGLEFKEHISCATNNFSEANKLGEGVFGPDYKGILSENQEVATKRLSKKSGQGYQGFMNDVHE